MKKFILAIFASIIAGIILCLAPGISNFISDDTVNINVDIVEEKYDNFYFTYIIAKNPSNFAINKLKFIPKSNGEIISIGWKINNLEKSIMRENIIDTLNIATLGIDEELKMSIYSTSYGLTKDVTLLFFGTYSQFDKSGRIVDYNFNVRSISEAKAESFVLFAKWSGFIIIIVGVSLVVVIFFRKRKNKNLPNE